MANKERGEVTVVLDKERTLRYTLNSLVYMEENGVNIQTFSNSDGTVKLKDLRTILYAGLIHEDEDLTPEKVGNLIDIKNLPAITEALNKAFGEVGK
jgi:hypothetical protein